MTEPRPTGPAQPAPASPQPAQTPAPATDAIPAWPAAAAAPTAAVAPAAAPNFPAAPSADSPRAPRPSRDRIDDVIDARQTAEAVLYEIRRVIVGQDAMLERVLVALLAGGHLLLEGVPGLAKTLTIKTLADVLHASFRRIQFTPDLVPGDLIGTRIYRPDRGTFDTELGPVFANFLLADEINRAPAKVQSALLEVMQERQVTIGHESHPVPRPFLVMATQNPIESEGTYPLPEAQVDRFMMKVVVGYPNAEEEALVVERSLRPAAILR
ncbi:MAG TPA: AAA family ATPase, partial [Candidatus Limnocylindrales bacterium]